MMIYLVRHGQVLHNVLKKYSTLNEDLTEEGKKQAQKSKEKLKNISFDLIITSPLLRARHTAQILAKENEKIVIDYRLKERNCGDLNGKPINSTDREEYWNYNTKISYGTSENIQEFFERIYQFLNDLKTKDYKQVLIVAHSGVSKAFNGYFEGIQDGKFLNRGLQNGEIKIYEF